jgi:hypothetical protein
VPIEGEAVIVEFRDEIGKNRYKAPVYKTREVEVENVLVALGPRTDLIESNRPDAVKVKYTLHFPKTFDEDLQGLRIKVRGNFYDVIGRPDHYTLENTPGDWWMPVEVGTVLN